MNIIKSTKDTGGKSKLRQVKQVETYKANSDCMNTWLPRVEATWGEERNEPGIKNRMHILM